jgi:uracil-DNA glycosylase
MDAFKKKIDRLISDLARTKVGPLTFNQYSYADSRNAVRRKNLALYLGEMRRFSPKVMLLSEAPGYKGARLTGVPFSSEHHLLTGIEQLGMFGAGKGYAKTSEFPRPQKEQSATIVWKALVEAGTVPLMWASFPFHPRKKESPWTNRKPTREEVLAGQGFFREAAAIFGIKEIVAVGRVAESSLKSIGVECEVIRHPANGGARDFRNGLLRVLGKS